MRHQVLLAASLALARASPIFEQSAAPSCPATVDSTDVAPYSVVPVSAKEPRRAFGTTTKAIVSPSDVCTWFAFNVPPNPSTSYCVLSFMFPGQDAVNSPYTIDGAGNFDIQAMFYSSGDNDVTPRMTWDSQPHGGTYTGAIQSYQNNFSPNGLVAISTGPCTKTTGNLQLFVRLCSNDTTLTYTQETNKCPIGLYLLVFPKKSSNPTVASQEPAPSTSAQAASPTDGYTGGVGR